MKDLKSKNLSIIKSDYETLKTAFAAMAKSPLCRAHVSGCLEYYYDTCQLSKALLNEDSVNSFADSYVPYLMSNQHLPYIFAADDMNKIQFTRYFMLQMVFQLLPIIKERVNQWLKQDEQSMMGLSDWHARRYNNFFDCSMKARPGEKDKLTANVKSFLSVIEDASNSYDVSIAQLLLVNEGFIKKKSMVYSQCLDDVVTKDDYYQEACFAVDRAYCMYEPSKSQILTFLEMVISSKFNNIRKKVQNENVNSSQKMHLVQDASDSNDEQDPLTSAQNEVDIESLMQILKAQDEKIQRMLSLRFGLSGQEESSYEFIASAVGRSRESIRNKDIPGALDILRSHLSV